MPTYEYECEGCSHRFERFQPMGSPIPKSCPECRKRKIRRLIGSGAGIIFRGSGFYQTDYRSADYQKRAKEDSGGASGGKSEKPKKADTAKGGDTSGGEKKKSPGSDT